MAALQTRLGIPRVQMARQITAPEPVIFAGLLCRRACLDVTALTEVAKDRVWLTRWTTAGVELPHRQDWLWYLAIMTCCAASTGPSPLYLQSRAETQRLATHLGAGTSGGAMTRLMAGALRRLCQCRLGWKLKDARDCHDMAASKLDTDPLLCLSTGLASALWGNVAWPVGIQAIEDSRLWIAPTLAHKELLHRHPIQFPLTIVRDLASRMDHLGIGLVIAGFAQGTREGIHVSRATWESLVSRITTCPLDRVIRRVEEAAAHLMASFDRAGFIGGIRVRFQSAEAPTRDVSDSCGPGRPKSRWSFFIEPAYFPVVSLRNKTGTVHHRPRPFDFTSAVSPPDRPRNREP